jgi:hypothetical protein
MLKYLVNKVTFKKHMIFGKERRMYMFRERQKVEAKAGER